MNKVCYFLTAGILLMTPLALINCFDYMPEPANTKVRGQVYDSVKQKMLGDVQVVVYECRNSYSTVALNCYSLVAFGVTNESGRYKIEFDARDKSDGYVVAVSNDASFHDTARKKVRPGFENFVTLYARETNHLKVRLKIENNSVGPIYMVSAFGNETMIPQHTRDTIVYGRVLPKTENHLITFRVYDAASRTSRRSEDFLNIDMSDTTYFEKSITDPAEWSAP